MNLYSGVAYRLDGRPPAVVFQDGLSARGSNDDVKKYVEHNAPSVWVGVTTDPEIARNHTPVDVPPSPEARVIFVYEVLVAGARKVADLLPHDHRLGSLEKEVLVDGGIKPDLVLRARTVNLLSRHWAGDWISRSEWLENNHPD